MYRLIALLSLAPALALAQLSTAELAGRITDQTGSVVAGARVTLRNTATGVERSNDSNDQGYYLFPAVQPGPYAVTARKAGFPDVTRDGIELQVDQRARVDFELKVGQVNEQVNVEASAVEVRTSSAELGSVMREKQVVDLPLNGRNFTQLLLLTPGASPISVGQNNGGGGSPTIGSFTYPSINGASNRSNIFFTDGVNNTNTFMTSYSVPPIIDAIQEFKVQSHNDQAEIGLAAGGVVNVVTKSGGNEFHGSAWEFMRNNVFDARNTFRSSVTALRQNMFGGAAGRTYPEEQDVLLRRLPGLHQPHARQFVVPCSDSRQSSRRSQRLAAPDLRSFHHAAGSQQRRSLHSRPVRRKSDSRVSNLSRRCRLC